MSEDSLFERLGGAVGVGELIHAMYDRVLADPELAPFFENVEMDKLRRMQFQFIASALDGPIQYTGAELTAIHKGRGITGRHFSQFCGHFAEAMAAREINQHDLDMALGRLATFRDRVLGETGIDG